MSDDVDLHVVTELDTAHAIRNTCQRLGCTFEDLHAMHRTSVFASARHKMAWYALGAYYDDRHHYANLLEESA